MHDYILVLKKSRQSAQRFYKTQVQLDADEGEEGYKEESGFIEEFPTVEEYFASLSLDDPQFWIDDARLYEFFKVPLVLIGLSYS